MTNPSTPSWPTRIHEAAEATARVALRTDDPNLLRRAAGMLDAIAAGVDEVQDSAPSEVDIAASFAHSRGLYLDEDNGTYELTDISARRSIVGPGADLDEVLHYLDLDEVAPGA